MANEFDNLSSDLTPGPKKPQLLSYQNIYDALKTKDPLLNQTGVFLPDGGFAKTPDDLKGLLVDENVVNNFFNFYKENPNFKSFGVSDSKTLQLKLKENNTGFAWTPSTKVEKIETYGLDKIDPSTKSTDAINEKNSIFYKIASNQLNFTPEGRQLGTVKEFEDFTYQPELFQDWVSKNKEKALEVGVNPYSVKDIFQTEKQKKTGDVDVEKQDYEVDPVNSELTNSLVMNFGISEDEIGMLVDESFSKPGFIMDISDRNKTYFNDQTGQSLSLRSVSMEDLYEEAINRGFTPEQAFSYLNSFRSRYLDKLAKNKDYENNSTAKTFAGAPETLGSKNSYQVGMDKKGFDMLDDPFKKVAMAYSKLDELTQISRGLKNEGAFSQGGKVFEIDAEIQKQKQLITDLQKQANISSSVIYDPVQRIPIDEQEAAVAFSKANSKFSQEYYNRTLFGEMKKQRNALFIQVEDLKQRIQRDVERLTTRQEAGLVGPESSYDQMALQSNRELYVQKYAELITLNKGIYTNSNPLKRDTEYAAESAIRVFNRDYLGGKEFYSKITPADEAYQLSKFMQNKGFYVSEKDLLKTKETVFEQVGSGMPATLQAMLEIGLYEAMGNQVGGAIAATKYFTAAKQFFKTKYGKAGTKFFEIFVEGGMELAIKEGAYIGAGQSSAGAAGEILSEKAFDSAVLNSKFKILVKNRSKFNYILGRYLSGVVGESVAETAGNIADLMSEYGYDFKKSFDLTTRDGQWQVILITSAILTAPGDVRTAFKTKQKFAEELVSRGAENIDPLTMEYNRLLEQVIIQTPSENVGLDEDLQPVEPNLPQEVVDMGDGPIEEPKLTGASEPTEASEQIPQEKVNEVKNKERLEVENRKANLGEEFHLVETDGTIDKNVTYRYDEKTGNLQSKGFSRFNSSWQDVNSDLKSQVETRVADSGMLSKTKGLEIAKEILGIEDDSKLVFKDGKLFYSKDQLQKNADQNIKSVKGSAKNQIQRLNEKAKRIKENIFADVEDAYTTSPTASGTSDVAFNKFLQIYKGAFGGKLRTNLHSLFFNGAKFNPDARKGIPRISDYLAPILDKFSRVPENNNIVNRVVSNIVNSQYFKESLGSDLTYLETEGLTSDAAMTLISDILIDSHDDVLENIFDGDEIKIQEFKTLRDNLNNHIQKEYTGKQNNANSPAFYNNRMEEVAKKVTDSEMAMTAKNYRVVEEEKRQIQNTGKMARGENYSDAEVAAIRYLQNKLGASDFLQTLNESVEGLTEEEIKELADKKANELNVYENFKGYQEKLSDFKKTRKARISKIKKDALDKNFDFEVYGAGATRSGDSLALQIFNSAIVKPLKLKKQKDYAAKLMNTMIEFAALRAGVSPDEFLDAKLHFDKTTKEKLAALEGKTLYSKDGEMEILKAMQDNADLVDGIAEKNLINASAFLDAGINPSIVFHATGWYKSTSGNWVYKYGHPERIQETQNLDVEKISNAGYFNGKLGELFDLPESLLNDFPELSNFTIILKLEEESSISLREIPGMSAVKIYDDSIDLFLSKENANVQAFQPLVERAISEMVIAKYGLTNKIKDSNGIAREVVSSGVSEVETLTSLSEATKEINNLLVDSDDIVSDLMMALYNDENPFDKESIQNLRKLIKADSTVKGFVQTLHEKTKITKQYFKVFENNLDFQENPVEFMNNNPLMSIFASLKSTESIEDIKQNYQENFKQWSEIQQLLNTIGDAEEYAKIKSKSEDLRKRLNVEDKRLHFLDNFVYSDFLLNDNINAQVVISGFLNAFSESPGLTEVQKQKILDFSNTVSNNYVIASSDLTNLGIYKLKEEINNPNFDRLFSELMAIDFQVLEKSKSALQLFVHFNTDFVGNVNLSFQGENTTSVFLDRVRELKNKKINPDELRAVRNTTGEKLKNLYGEELVSAKEKAVAEFEEVYKNYKERGVDYVKEFLGNSVTFDEDGNPMVFYRGARSVYGRERDSVFYTTRISKASSYLAPDTGGSINLLPGVGSNIRTSFIKMENPIVIDAKGSSWANIDLTLGQYSTDSIVSIAKDALNNPTKENILKDFVKDPSKVPDGIIFKNIVDYGISVVGDTRTPGDVYVPLNTENVLLANVTLFQNDGTIRAAVNVNKHGKSIIYAVTDPNVSSPLHEMAHVLEDYLSDSEKQAVLEFAGETDWNVNTSETFARGFEKYLMEGVSPSKQMETVFEKFKAWLTEIYTALGLENLGKDLNPEMRSIYNTIFGVSEQNVQEDANIEDELFDFIDSQRQQKISDDQIYKGLIEAGYKPEDVSEYFTLRTKQTVLSQMANKGEFSEAARAISSDTVTVKRTFDQIVQELAQLDDLQMDAVLANLENMRDLDKALVAKILLMRKMRSEKKDISGELSEIAEIGTNAGRILQRMRMLKKETEDVTLANVLKELDKRNVSIPPRALERLKKLSNTVSDIRSRYETAKQVAAQYPMEVSATNPSMTNYEHALDLREQYQKARFEFYSQLRDYARSISYSDLYQTLVRGNLLTVGSMVINLTSNVAKSVVNIPINFLATGFGAVKHKFFNSDLVTFRGVGYYSNVVGSYGKAWQEMTKTITMGSVVEDANGLQVNRGFNGFRALRDSFGMLIGAISGENKSLTDEQFAEKYKLPLDKNGKVMKKSVIHRVAEGVFGFTAEANFRALGGPDAFFKTTAYWGALYEQGRTAGLSDVPDPKLGGRSKLQMFMELNADYSNESAMREALKLIYANDGTLYKGFQALFGTKLGGNKIMKSLVTTQIPFQKIPSNVAQEFFFFAVPEIGYVTSAWKQYTASGLEKQIRDAKLPSQKKRLREEKQSLQRESELDLARAVVAHSLHFAANLIIQQFAVSGSSSPAAGVDDKERRWKEEFKPADYINITLLLENARNGFDKKRKDWLTTDKKIQLRDLGMFGAILSIKQTAIEKFNRGSKVIDLVSVHTKYEDNMSTDLANAVPYLLDQTMLKGVGDAVNVLFETESDAWAAYASGFANTMVTALAPNHANQITKIFREFDVDYRPSPEDKEQGFVYNFEKTLRNNLKEKVPFVFDNDYVVRYDVIGKPRRQKGKMVDPVLDFFGIKPKRREVGIDHTIDEISAIIKGDKKPTWKDLIYIGFVYGDSKSVIPPDIAGSVQSSANLGIKKSLNQEEKDYLRENLNPIREGLVDKIINGVNFNPLLDVNSIYNKRPDGTAITFGDKNIRFGYYILSEILNTAYKESQSIVETTLGPKIINQALEKLTPEERLVVDKVTKENISGVVFKKLEENKDLTSVLEKEGLKLKDLFKNFMMGTDEIEETETKVKRPRVIVNGVEY
jgi:hypothetical protein